MVTSEAYREVSRMPTLTPDSKRSSSPDGAEYDFIAMVGHELRGPLAVMSNVVSVCRLEEGVSRLPDALEILERQIRKAARLVDDLLAHAYSGEAFASRVVSPVNLAAVVTEVALDLGREIRSRDQSLALQMPSGPAWVRGDELRLAQIVWNLLDNASKYSGAGQPIAIDLRCELQWVTLHVRDEGIGIPPEVLPQIFHRYVRAENPSPRTRPGLGLGLAITRQLVSQHDGLIEAYSEGRGRGSRFTVRLPSL